MSQAEEVARSQQDLVNMLGGLVPLWLLKLRGRSVFALTEAGPGLADKIASNTDRAMHGRGRERAEAVSAIAEALAVLALLDPGGFEAFGQHWCADHHVCRKAAT